MNCVGATAWRRSTFAVLLIGKDGGVKLRSGRPFALHALFDAIDAMPMRQDEMRRRAAGPHAS